MDYFLGLVGLALVVRLQLRRLRETDLGYTFVYAYDLDEIKLFAGPFYAGLIVTAGAAIYGVYGLATDAVVGLSSSSAVAGLVARSVLFWGVLYLKAMLGPSVVAYYGGFTLGGWLSTGELVVEPFVRHFLSWVFVAVSPPIHLVYLVFVCLYGLAVGRGLLSLHPPELP